MPRGLVAALRRRRPPQRRPLRSAITLFAAFTMVSTVSGCGLLSGSEGSSDESGGPNGLEKSQITVGQLPIIESTPLHIAQERGYFKQEGLDVNIVNSASGPAGVNSLVGGDLDIALSSYVPYFAAKSKGMDLKIVADSYSAKPGVLMLMANPNSGITKPEDVLGKRVAVSGRGTISDLSLMSTLKTHGLNYNKVNWVTMPLADQAAALQRGDIDAAVMTEPFITKASKSNGAVAISDMNTGPTADFPISGWGATGEWAKKNPKTMAAFQRAISRAARDATNERSAVEQVLPKFAKVDPQTAKLIKLGNFESTLEPNRIQRVPTLMREFGLLPKPTDAKDVVVPMPPQE